MKTKFINECTAYFFIGLILLLLSETPLVHCRLRLTDDTSGVRERRGAAYAGGHPGGGYGQGGVGIPGLNNVIQYTAYNKLLNRGNHGQSSGYGHSGGSRHGRKLTVDQAIGMFGHHTLNQPYPYSETHGSTFGGHDAGAGRSVGSHVVNGGARKQYGGYH